MQLARRLRLPAVLCSLAVLLCELISRPYTSMGVCDDGPYILMAQKLAATGHILYNGNITPMLGWELYLGAAFIKLFGFSFTAARMSTLLVALLTAFLLQRTLVRAGIHERNATLGTLALVLSPIYLMLSATYMSDVFGLFSILLCLYGCLRSLQSASDRATILWLCFAVFTNALFGTSRQIAWLGVLVMIPSALYLLRSRRRVLLAGLAVNLLGGLFILACMQWFLRQPYNVHEHLLPKTFSVATALLQIAYSVLDLPYLLLPVTLLFLPQLRKLRLRTLAIFLLLFSGYVFLATYPSHLRGNVQLLPMGSGTGLGEWNNVTGIFAYDLLQGKPPIVIGKVAQVLLTLLTLGGVVGLIASLRQTGGTKPAPEPATAESGVVSREVSWRQLSMLLAPFFLTYYLLLIPRSVVSGIRDRYFLGLLVVILLCLLRSYQDQIQQRLPLVSIPLVAAVALYAVMMTHNMFSLYRARVALANELVAAGVAPTAIDHGWEQNMVVELQHSNHINDPRTTIPADAYKPAPPLPAGSCKVVNYDQTPHVRPLYGASFDPNACYGPAPFAPVHYSRWPYSTPGTLYAVRYLPPRA